MDGPPLRILHILMNNARHPSRVRRSCEAATELWPRAEIEVLALRRKGEEMPELERWAERVRLVRLELPRRKLGRVRYPSSGLALWWAAAVLVRLWRFKPDIVCLHNATALPLLPFIRLLTKSKVILDAHELESESASLVGRPVYKWIVKTIERVGIRAVDGMIVVNDSIADWYRQTYPGLNPVVVKNIYIPPRLPAQVGDYFRLKYSIPKSTAILLYQGNLGVGRGIEQYIGLLDDRRGLDIAVVLMGYGDWQERLKALESRYPGRLFVHEAVPSERLMEYTACADFGLSVIAPICISYHMALPNKIFEYLSAGLPVIGSDGPEIRRVIEQFDVGVAVPSDVDSIRRAVVQLLARDRDELRHNALNAVRNFTWDGERERLVALLRTLQPGAARVAS
jgi:glycosyltransferase involved in cell wall biosynthesis